MLKESRAFSGFSVLDLAVAQDFYTNMLGLDVEADAQGLRLQIAGGNGVFIYAKPDHVAATYTVLNFPVDDIEREVDELAGKGIKFEHYGRLTDARGIARGASTGGGPDIAWFKDPFGNILAVLQEADPEP